LRQALFFALLLAAAIALNFTSFGDTNRHADETFYFLVGQRMHEGLLPYVDIWDRKPFGLFLVYYLIAGISTSVLSYQLAACALAAATALLVGRLVSFWADGRGGILAGILYLFAIGPFEGSTGQAPDIYNPLIALAALLISQELVRLLEGRVNWRIWAAMAACGLAITIKQTSLFESAFFGLTVLFCLLRAGVPPMRIAGVAALSCVLGALPTLLVAGFYWQAGHFYEFWHAMVISNLSKAAQTGEAWRALVILVRVGPLLALTGWAIFAARTDRRAKIFLSCWLAAALLGFLSVPNFYAHYVLPVLVPLCVVGGLGLASMRMAVPVVAALLVYATIWHSPDRREWTRGSIDSMNTIADRIRAHDPGGGLLVFDAPVYLYALTGERFLSPLVFPHHLNHAIEEDVSHLDTSEEIDRILANRPGVIVMSRYPRNKPVNPYSRSRVLDYARRNCSYTETVGLHEERLVVPTVIFGECGTPREG